jgi:pimeloyl-ACP methyl ester carboxylesterase
MSSPTQRKALEMSPETPTATVVLVHGAWADGSSWGLVITALQQAGLTVTAAPIPLTSLGDDVAALDRTIDRTEGPVILAAHAYAGAVIAASAHPRISGIVFITALAPDEGETVADVFYRDPPHPQAPTLQPDDDGWIWLPANGFSTAFAQNATPDQAALLSAVQRPIAAACIQEPVSKPGWKDRQSWYLVAEEDRMINPRTQAFMAKRMNAHTKSCSADHAPLITAAAEVTDLISLAVATVRDNVKSG